MSPPPPSKKDGLTAIALGLLSGLLYFRTAPAVVNPDGLGYLKRIPNNFASGHLLYLPLLRVASALCRGDGLLGGRILSAAAGAGAVVLLFVCARSLGDRFAALLAAAGLAVSFGLWAQGADVEVYSCALLALLFVLALALAYRAAPSAWRALPLGLAWAGAVLIHLVHILLAPFVLLWCIQHARSRRAGLRNALIAGAIAGAITLASYAWAAHVRHLDLAGLYHWVATSAHGFPYHGGPIDRLADAIYGLAKALVWSPYLYESNAQTLLGQFLLGLLPLALLLGAVVARHKTLPLPGGALLLWSGAYLVFALAFFASDHERWIFVLPPLWLAGAAAIATYPRRELMGAGLILYLALANAVTAIGPARHYSWPRTRADAAAELMRPGDLVFFPGHSWDEYLGFYTHTAIVPFPISYYWALDGQKGCLARLEREITAAHQRGARIFTVRIFAPPDEAGGFAELSQLGLAPESLRALFDRFTAVPLSTREPKITVWRLDERRATDRP